METTIKKTLEETVGKTKVRIDKPKKTRTDEIKKLRKIRKEAKQEFQLACKDGTDKTDKKDKYINAQKALREEIEREENKQTEMKINRLIEQAKTDPNTISQTRKKNKVDNELDYNTITEEGETLTDPEETKNYIADRYEELYQARPGTPEYEEWTNTITKKVKEIQENHNKDDPTQGSEPITMKELNKVISKLKRGKSLGPDEIPNEVLIEATTETRKIYLEMINHIHKEEIIPQSWLEGNIKRLYKGKGIKGKCSNERGITLASNMGKVYERIINERIKPIVKITDAQAGGIEGNATVDHLITLKQAIS